MVASLCEELPTLSHHPFPLKLYSLAPPKGLKNDSLSVAKVHNYLEKSKYIIIFYCSSSIGVFQDSDSRE